MSDLRWHFDKAKQCMDDWYTDSEKFLRQKEFFLNLVIPATVAVNDVQRKALHCKTAGLVWHDRFKMILDVQRRSINE